MERLPRTFRRTRFGGHLPTLAVCALIVALTVPLLSSGASADDLNDKQDQVKKGIKQAAASLDESSSAATAAAARLEEAKQQLTVAQDQLAAAEGRLTAARVLDAQMQEKLRVAKARLARAELELRAGEAAVVDQRADVGRLAAENFQKGDPRLMGLSVILNSQDPTELIAQLNTVDTLMDREVATLDRFRATEALLVVQRAEVDAAKAEVAKERRAAAAHLAEMTRLEQQAKAAQDEVTRLVGQRTTADKAARAARAADLKKLRALKREEERIRQLILERARSHKGGYNGPLSGLLYRPVPGYVTSSFGYRRHPIYGYWGLHNGADFHATCGTPLRAAASGVVISRYYSEVWGNRLIIDAGRVNGKTLTLVYNHISRYVAGDGATVGRSDVVAYAGSTGWSTGCHLHFTVLLNGNPVDPLQFF